MAMEFLEGVDLREAIRAQGARPPRPQARGDGADRARASPSRTRAGSSTATSSPRNIHIQPSGHVKILDFGLAQLGASELTRSGTVMGTPHYMSPEQLRGQKADARADVFSLGAIFYEILSGQRAFENRADARGAVPACATASPCRCASAPRRRRRCSSTIVERAMARTRASVSRTRARWPRRSSTRARRSPARRSRHRVPGGRPSGRCCRRRRDDHRALAPRPGRAPRRDRLERARRRRPPRAALPHDAPRGDDPGGRPGARLGAPPGPARRGCRGAGAGRRRRRFWLRQRTAAPSGGAAPAAPAAQDQLGMITPGRASSKLALDGPREPRLRRRGRERPRGALPDPTNADAKALLEQAEKAQQELDAAVAEARAAAARGDTPTAPPRSGACWRSTRATPSRRAVGQPQPVVPPAGRGRAPPARPRAPPPTSAGVGPRRLRRGRSCVAEADTVFQREQFTAAAQKYLAARDGFEAARARGREPRAAAAARAAAAQPQPAPAPARPHPADAHGRP